jgi:hypothetical protein
VAIVLAFITKHQGCLSPHKTKVLESKHTGKDHCDHLAGNKKRSHRRAQHAARRASPAVRTDLNDGSERDPVATSSGALLLRAVLDVPDAGVPLQDALRAATAVRDMIQPLVELY